jgi:DNA-3-methyladenine glycosylase I
MVSRPGSVGKLYSIKEKILKRHSTNSKIALYKESKVQELMQDAGIIRNQLKIRGTIINAQQFLSVQKEFGSFDRYIWQFTDYSIIDNAIKETNQIPASSPESDAMSRDLRKRGFKFVGTTICYAFMQATGMVNDHLVSCPRHQSCGKAT